VRVMESSERDMAVRQEFNALSTQNATIPEFKTATGFGRNREPVAGAKPTHTRV